MRYQDIEDLAAAERLTVSGAFHPGDGDGLPPACRTLILLSPGEAFWEGLAASPEYRDDAPDPIDRWSRRVIDALAARLGGTAHYPFGGPPYTPFTHWARRSGLAWSSPVHMLSHDSYGLMISYRGAIALAERLELPSPPTQSGCNGCERPCLSACPAGAIDAERYDVALCHAYLENHPDAPCLSRGCAVRRACPVSQSSGRLEAQSAYHMGQFHP